MEVSEIRPEVLLFAEQMEEALRLHDDDRGCMPQSIPYHDFFYRRLMDERDELMRARHDSFDIDAEKEECQARIRREAVDVANFAMFIAFWDGDLDAP